MQAHPKERIISPKQSGASTARDWYQYYAGFPEAFVEHVIERHAEATGAILDPWSGSGTTTAVAVRTDRSSAGLDINPALTVVARARLLPKSQANRVQRDAGAIVRRAARTLTTSDSADPLAQWMKPRSAAFVRGIQSAIHDRTGAESPLRGSLETVDDLPLTTCFLYTALFATVRGLVERFRGTNPTWIRPPKSARHRIFPAAERTASHFLEWTTRLAERLRVTDVQSASGVISTGTAIALPFDDDGFDACITSPPYATRIDYVMNSLPELAVLGLDPPSVDLLRSASMGGPVVNGWSPDGATLLSATGVDLLNQVRDHGSKGSRNYYHPWLARYLLGLQGALHEVARVVRPAGPICLVLQDSYYKTLHIDLQRIATDILTSVGRSPMARHDFEVRNSMAWLHPRSATQARRQPATESLLIFQ